METAKILKCTCKNSGQDALHGSNMRIFNQVQGSKNATQTFRCTVCAVTKQEK